MQIAIVGCGYVAGFYMVTLKNFPSLILKGAYDIDQERLKKFCNDHVVQRYESLDELCNDDDIDIVVNLTWIKSHYDVTKQALIAGKHVYSEKPISYTVSEAEELVEIADRKGLRLSVAPCNLLGPAGKTVKQMLSNQVIGKVLLVHANLEDGPVYLMGYEDWKSPSGISWPYEEEFQMGCVYEHAGYYLSWLIHFFGPIKELSAFSSTIVDESTGRDPGNQGTDFCVAGLRHESGVCTNFVCSSISPSDNSLRIIGEKGVIEVKDCWDCNTSVTVSMLEKVHPENGQNSKFVFSERVDCRLVSSHKFDYQYRDSHNMNFAAGIEDLRLAIENNIDCIICGKLGLHVLETVNLIEKARTQRLGVQRLSSTYSYSDRVLVPG